ncbi:hypothetical protein PM082_009700 [Marasmius tenuissimus]|nr:hypothetical protein PM082_009700 [Marasmius tenuissimus]
MMTYVPLILTIMLLFSLVGDSNSFSLSGVPSHVHPNDTIEVNWNRESNDNQTRFAILEYPPSPVGGENVLYGTQETPDAFMTGHVMLQFKEVEKNVTLAAYDIGTGSADEWMDRIGQNPTMPTPLCVHPTQIAVRRGTAELESQTSIAAISSLSTTSSLETTSFSSSGMSSQTSVGSEPSSSSLTSEIPAKSTQPTNGHDESNSNKSSAGIIVGSVIGSFLALILCLVLGLWYWRRKCTHRHNGAGHLVPIPHSAPRVMEEGLDDSHSVVDITYEHREFGPLNPRVDEDLSMKVNLMAQDLAELRMMVDRSQDVLPEYRR